VKKRIVRSTRFDGETILKKLVAKMKKMAKRRNQK